MEPFAFRAAQLYVRIWRNRFSVSRIGSQAVVKSIAGYAFTSSRLLIGDFTAAVRRLRNTFLEIVPSGLLRPAIIALMHPLEMVEGGLCPVEERLLLELAAAAGARRCVAYVCAELSLSDVETKLLPSSTRMPRWWSPE